MICNPEVVTGKGAATPLLRKLKILPGGTWRKVSVFVFGRAFWVNLEHVAEGSHIHFLKFLSSNMWEILCSHHKFTLNQMGCLSGD